MQFIIKTFSSLNYIELHVADDPVLPGEPLPVSRLVGHFTLRPNERDAFIGRLLFGRASCEVCLYSDLAKRATQEEADRIFEDAIHQGASPEPITAAEPPPPSGREVIYQRPGDEGSGEHPLIGQQFEVKITDGRIVAATPVSIPDPVGRTAVYGPRTRRTCCASFVGDPHGYGCQLVAADPLTPRPGLDGSAQTERIKNARQGGAIDAGEVIDLGPVSQQGEARFVAVKGPGADTIEGFGWNALDRETGRYRMPGWVCSEGAARRTAERANADPEQFAPRYIWEG